MPAILEKKLKSEYGSEPAYKIMNARSFMSKEAAKGRKHDKPTTMGQLMKGKGD